MRLSFKYRAWYYSENQIKYSGDVPFKTMLIFVKFAVELVTL